MDTYSKNLTIALINEHLMGLHTAKQLESLLKKDGIKLHGIDKGKAKILVIVSSGGFREKLYF